MKVICCNNSSVESHLTIDKIYNVISQTGAGFVVISDDGDIKEYFRYRFKTMDQVRSSKIDQILD